MGEELCIRGASRSTRLGDVLNDPSFTLSSEARNWGTNLLELIEEGT